MEDGDTDHRGSADCSDNHAGCYQLYVKTNYAREAVRPPGIFVIHCLERAEGFVDALDGETHDVEVAAVELRHADIAYPLLDAVGAGFVEGTVMGYVIVDFVVRERLEGDVGKY